MKFTQGYWLRSERANALYAAHAYDIQRIPGGIRVLAPCKVVTSREDTLNLPVITIEFTASGKDMIAVRSWHYEAYESKEASFEKEIQPSRAEVEVNITDQEAVMVNGRVTLRVNRKDWGYRFEADGNVITECSFRNLGYIRYDREKSTMLPEDNYLLESYKPYMVTELSLKPGECVYGMGERFGAFVKNGQVVETWNEDGGTSSQIAYKCIPFYMTNRGYGIFVDHTTNVSFEVASEKVEYVGFSVPGEELRYHFIYGPSPKEIMGRYTMLMGRPALPPAWSFGLWLSTSFTTNYDEETTTSFIQGMFERNIPLSVFHFDCFWMKEFQWCDFIWDKRVFPNVREVLKKYKEKGLKIDLWINPYIAQGTELFKESVKKGYLLKRKDKKGIKQIDWWQPGMGLVDFTNPEACDWYAEQLKSLLDMGIDCFKTDFGERIPVDVIYDNENDPVSMHNYYTYLYNKCVFELLKKEKGEKEAVVFARSATAGSQKFPVHWGGDCSASYSSMAETLRGGLSLAMSGFAFWSHDISGFEQTAAPDLYKRWTAFGLLSTHSRLHGSSSYRVPWLFDEESSDVLRSFTNLKCRLMPYIYEMSIVANKEGIPVMRPMIFEFPEEAGVNYLDMQYMLGDSLLIAPIFNENGIADFYLPKGLWTDFFTGETKEGGRWYQGTYDYFSLPMYIRENTILPMGDIDARPDYDYAKNITLHLYQLGKEKTAVCEIPAVDGSVQLKAKMTRTENSILVELSKLTEGIRIILHGIPAVKEIQNASYKEEKRGIEIKPEVTNIQIML